MPERIGNHAMNIGETIIHLVPGRDIRQLSIRGIEREISL
jgi:phosphate uptake regulator